MREKPIYKRKILGESVLEHRKPGLNIDTIDDEELGKLIKFKLIKWQDIKEWAERKKLNKKQLKR